MNNFSVSAGASRFLSCCQMKLVSRKKFHHLNSSNGFKLVHKTSISSIWRGSQDRPFDGIVILLEGATDGDSNSLSLACILTFLSHFSMYSLSRIHAMLPIQSTDLWPFPLRRLLQLGLLFLLPCVQHSWLCAELVYSSRPQHVPLT